MLSMCADALARQLFVDDRMPVDKAVGTFIVCSAWIYYMARQKKRHSPISRIAIPPNSVLQHQPTYFLCVKVLSGFILFYSFFVLLFLIWFSASSESDHIVSWDDQPFIRHDHITVSFIPFSFLFGFLCAAASIQLFTDMLSTILSLSSKRPAPRPLSSSIFANPLGFFGVFVRCLKKKK